MIEQYLAHLRDALRVSSRRRDRILDDVRDHLIDAAEHLQRDGLETTVAEQRAIAAFGPAAHIAEQFNRDAATATLRHAPVVMAASGVAVVAGFLIATLTQPTPGLPKPAGLARQIAFFAGLVGLQVAFVAGARALARAGARLRTTATSSDFRLIRNSALVFLGGLTTTTAGWTVALIDAVDRLPHGDVGPLVAGLIVMVSGSLLAIVTCRRWRRTLGSAAADVGDHLDTSALAAPERLIRAMAVRPWLFCTSAAVLAALTVMSRAETTVLGALPWGGAEAAVVVLGYVWLGPALELRT